MNGADLTLVDMDPNDPFDFYLDHYLQQLEAGYLADLGNGANGPSGLLVITPVVSMGRCNTASKSNLQVFQWLNSFESADSKKTLPCLGLIEYSPKDQVSLKNTIGSTE